MSIKIKQEIEFNADFEYFAGFLNYIIKKSNINAVVEFKEKRVILKIDENDEKRVEEFNNNIIKYLPHSLFLGNIKTFSCKDDTNMVKRDFISSDYEISPCNFCINEIINSHYLNDEYRCNHYSNEGKLLLTDNFTYSPNYSPNSILLIRDRNNFNELFIATKEEKEALFSIEKPTLKLTIKSSKLKKLTSKNYIFVKAPWSIKSILAVINAKENNFDYLFFNDNDDLKAVVIEKSISFIKANRLLPKLKDLHEDKIINRFLNILDEAKFENGIGIYLNKQKISFLVKNEVGVKEVLKIDNFDNKKLIEDLKKDEIRSRLITNFKNKFNTIYRKIENEKLSLFEVIGVILEVNGGFEEVSDKSLEFLGNGGLKVDFKFNNKEFDYVALIGSLMSFKLAKVENHYLAYSFFEGLGDFSLNIANQLKSKFKIKDLTFFGSILANNVLYSRILSKSGIDKPYFAKLIAFDE